VTAKDITDEKDMLSIKNYVIKKCSIAIDSGDCINNEAESYRLFLSSENIIKKRCLSLESTHKNQYTCFISYTKKMSKAAYPNLMLLPLYLPEMRAQWLSNCRIKHNDFSRCLNNKNNAFVIFSSYLASLSKEGKDDKSVLIKCANQKITPIHWDFIELNLCLGIAN
jgi:hypothetical protein